MAWQSFNDVYIPKSGGGDIEGSLSVSGNLVVNDGSGNGTTYDVASEISDLKSAWDSVSPSFITVTCGEKFTGSNTSGNYINLSKRYELVGDGFTLSNSGVVCNFNGYVAASMSAYIRGGANSTVQIYLHQNEADVLSVAREADGNAQLTMSPFTLRVKNGDLIRLSGRTWDDVGSFTLRANTMTYMTLQKIIATSQQPICR